MNIDTVIDYIMYKPRFLYGSQLHNYSPLL